MDCISHLSAPHSKARPPDATAHTSIPRPRSLGRLGAREADCDESVTVRVSWSSDRRETDNGLSIGDGASMRSTIRGAD